MSTFNCAQRGCKFTAAKAPAKCPVCRNPFVATDGPAANDEDAPWSDYTLKELQEYANDWDCPISRSDWKSKKRLIALLEAAESAEA